MSRLRMEWDWFDYGTFKVRVILFTRFLEFIHPIEGGQLCRFEVNVCLGEQVTPGSRRWKVYIMDAKSRDKVTDLAFVKVRHELKAEGVPDWVILRGD